MLVASTVARLVALMVVHVGLVAGDFSWPGALEADGRALTALPEPDRPAGVERLVGRHGLKAAGPYLLPLLSDPAPEVRAYVGRLLARAGEPTALAAAVDWLTAPERPPADRSLGLDLLSHAPTLTPEARRAIEQAIRDRDAPVRIRALAALGRHDPLPSLPVVLGALDDDSREVRLAAALLVEEVARQHADAPEAARLATLPLLERLDDADRSIRQAALRALGALGDPRASPALVRIASEQMGELRTGELRTGELRTAAVDALGSPAMAEGAALTTLVRLSRHRPVDELARHADLALGQIAAPAAVAALVAALEAPPVPEEAKLGLLHAGRAAVEALAGQVTRGTPSSAALAAVLLGEIGDRRATDALTRAIAAPEGSATVVRVAIEALERLRDPAAVPALARAAEAPQADVRLQAFAALQALADPRSVGVLDGGLADRDPRIRASAAQLAGRLAARAVAPALADRLGDGDPEVRLAAARALARAGGAPLARVLTALVANAAKTKTTTTARDSAELEAIGDALEANVTAADGARLEEAFLAAEPGLQGPLARGLGVAHATGPLLDNSAVVDRATALLATGGASALAAADLLATARLSDAEVTALARAFAEAEPSVRGRLCAAIARTPRGGGWLASLMASPSEPLQVRAAAAWCARGLADARSALESAARSPQGPLAANARAALAAGAGKERGGPAIRLRASDGEPLVGRWVTLEGGGVTVAAMTDETGLARVDGPANATVAAWHADGLSPQAAPTGPTGP
jgi:HEAT repeat protein